MTVLAAGGMNPTHITVFLLSLALLLGLARVLGELARQLKQPAVLGEIFAGVVLGPTIFGAISPMLEPGLGIDAYQMLFPAEGPARTALDGFVLISATLLLLVVGIEVDLSTVWRQGRAMALVSACGIGVPFSIGFSLAWYLPWMLSVDPAGPHRLPFAIFLGIALSITALPVIAKILMDLNLAKSDLGVLVISSAMLNDVVGWIGFAVVLALLGAGGGASGPLTPGQGPGSANSDRAPGAFPTAEQVFKIDWFTKQLGWTSDNRSDWPTAGDRPTAAAQNAPSSTVRSNTGQERAGRQGDAKAGRPANASAGGRGDSNADGHDDVKADAQNDANAEEHANAQANGGANAQGEGRAKGAKKQKEAAQVTQSPSQTGVGATIGLTIGFLLFMLTIGRWLCHRTLPYVQAQWSWPGGTLVFVLAIGLICAAFTTWLGIHSIFGAFVAGIAIGDSHHLTERTRDTIHQFIINIFAPVFFASIGLRINFVERFDLLAVVVVFAVACIGKISGCFLGAKLARMSTREAGAVGFGMVAQGAVGIILGQLAQQAGLISEELLVAIVIMAVGTSLLAGPAMQRILRTKTKRDLVDLLTDRHVLTRFDAATPEQAITQLAHRAGEFTRLDPPSIARAVIERERIMHTGMSGGLAVPHARLAQLSRSILIVGRHRDGVNFDAPDGELARLICLILTPEDRPQDQIEMLSLVAGTFSRPEIAQRLMRAESPTEFRATLNLARSEG